MLPAIPAPVQNTGPIGSPPSDRHYWGYFPELGQYGWRLKDGIPQKMPRKVEGESGSVSDVIENHGVDASRIHTAPKYSINGVEASRLRALREMTGGSIFSDDSDRWHLTAVGDAGFLEKFRSDVATLPDPLKSRILVQAYTPDRWEVSIYKLPVGVNLRKPSPIRTAANVGAIPAGEYTAAKLVDLLTSADGPDPKIVPKPDPAPVNPDQPAPANPVPNFPVWLAIAIAALVVIIWRKR